MIAEPGDRLVFLTESDLARSELHIYSETLREIFPENEVFVIGGIRDVIVRRGTDDNDAHSARANDDS
jgi:hypothetical protein